MRSGEIAVTLAAIVVFSGIAQAFRSEPVMVAQDTPAIRVGTTSPQGTPVQVDDLATSPSKFKGVILVKAAVAKVSKEKGVFWIFDERELAACGKEAIGCAKYYLPVTFAGQLPEPEAVVLITGEVIRSDSGFIFAAKRVEAK